MQQNYKFKFFLEYQISHFIYIYKSCLGFMGRLFEDQLFFSYLNICFNDM